MNRLKFANILWVVISFVCFATAAQSADIYLDNSLLAASTRGDTAVVRDMLSKGAYINARDRLGNTPLILAADAGYQEIVRLLLKEKAAINAMNVYGYTPLLSAITNSRRYIAYILIKAGADPDIPNKYGTSPRMYIRAQGFFTIEEYISDEKPAMSVIIDKRPERRGVIGSLHNEPWREKFNNLVSAGKSSQAADYLVETATKGVVEAEQLLGILLIEKNNPEKGLEWLKKSYQSATGGMLYEIGVAAYPYDEEFAIESLQKAIGQGVLAAKSEYARILFEKGKYGDAYPLFADGAGKGNSESLFYTGYMNFAGKGVAKDEPKGLELINNAAKAGSSGAKNFINMLSVENIIKRLSTVTIEGKTTVKSDFISMNIPIINGKAGCDTFDFGETFGNAYGIVNVELCYPGDGSVITTYYMLPSTDSDMVSYLKNISSNGVFKTFGE